MTLKSGDVVSLSLRPPLQLSRYQHLKTAVQLTRTVGDDPEKDLQEMREELRRLYFAQLHEDLGLTGELTTIIEQGSIEELAAYALRNANPDAQVENRPKKRRKAD